MASPIEEAKRLRIAVARNRKRLVETEMALAHTIYDIAVTELRAGDRKRVEGLVAQSKHALKTVRQCLKYSTSQSGTIDKIENRVQALEARLQEMMVQSKKARSAKAGR